MKKTLLLLFLMMNATVWANSLVLKQRKVLSSTGWPHSLRYSQGNRAVSSNGKTFVGWLEADKDVKVKSYNHSNNTWDTTVKIGTADDDHGSPVLLVNQEGYLHSLSGAHNSDFDYMISSNPWNISTWTNNSSTSLGGLSTYPSFVIDKNGTIHVAYRSWNVGATSASLRYQYKPKNGNWSFATTVVSMVSGFPTNSYANYFHSLDITDDGELRLLFNLFYEHNLCYVGQRSRFTGYLKKSLLNNGTWTYTNSWKSITNNTVTLPVTKDTTSGVMIRSVATLESPNNWGYSMKVSGLVHDSQQRPWFIMNETQDTETDCHQGTSSTNSKNYLYHYNGASWVSTDIATLFPSSMVNPRLADYLPGLSIDKNDNIYIAGILAQTVSGSTQKSINILHKNIHSSTTQYESLEIAPYVSGRLYHQLSIERSVNQEGIGFPWLLFSYVNSGDDANTESHVEAAQIGY